MTLDRWEQVDFTLVTFVTGGSLLTMADDPVAGTEALAGKRVAIIGATSTESGLTSYLEENRINARVVRVSSSEEGMSELVDGSVDAFAPDQIVLVGDALNAMEADDDLDFFFSPQLLSYEPYALMVRRNDADFRLVANRAIAQIFRSGEFGELYETWIGSFRIDPSPLLLAMYQGQALSE